MVNPTLGVPSVLCAVAVIGVFLVVPSAFTDWLGGESVSAAAVWVMVAEPLWPVADSVAVTRHVPAVVEAVYVVVAWPLPLVVAVLGLTVPHEPGVLGLPTLKVTMSPGTGLPPWVTVAVTTEVLVPLAGMLDGLALTATLFGGGGAVDGPK